MLESLGRSAIPQSGIPNQPATMPGLVRPTALTSDSCQRNEHTATDTTSAGFQLAARG